MIARTVVLAAAVAAAVAAAAPLGQLAERPLSVPLTHAAIEYTTRPTHDVVSALNRAIEAGTAVIAFDEQTGYLRSVLDALHVRVESQMLVMSKTGVQGLYTGPDNPRAIFFNDATSVGYIRGAPLLELAVQDPEQGVLFYTIDQKPQPRPLLERRSGCLTCHKALGTLHVPGLMARSLSIAPDGLPGSQYGRHDPDDTTPFQQRWGGWYVTGTHGAMTHRGRSTASFDAHGYLSAQSDIAALMVFGHQVRMTNLITRVGWDARLGVPIEDAVDEFVDYLLFVDEAPLTDAVEGTTDFAERFSALGPQDHRGRSLRQLDLQTRLLRYPCSYMIYSDAFTALPAGVKRAIYARMGEILSGRDAAPKYARFAEADRRAVAEILRDTLADLPADLLDKF